MGFGTFTGFYRDFCRVYKNTLKMVNPTKIPCNDRGRLITDGRVFENLTLVLTLQKSVGTTLKFREKLWNGTKRTENVDENRDSINNATLC